MDSVDKIRVMCSFILKGELQATPVCDNFAHSVNWTKFTLTSHFLQFAGSFYEKNVANWRKKSGSLLEGSFF